MLNTLEYQSSSWNILTHLDLESVYHQMFRLGRWEVYFLDKKISQVNGDYFDLYTGHKDKYMESTVMPKAMNHIGLH